MSSEFSAFKVPKEKDFLKVIEDAEEAGVLDKAAKAVNNPLSWLRFIPTLGVGIRQAEKQAKEQGIQNPLFQKGFKETDEERDLAKELDRAIIDGPVRAVKGVLEFVIRNCVVTDVPFPGVYCEERFVFEALSFKYVSHPS